MIVKSEDFGRFIARPKGVVFVYLLYGTDPGLVHERARQLAKGPETASENPFQTVRLSGDQIAADPGLLADETGVIGLFGDQKVIWIEAGGKSFIDSLNYQLENPPQNCILIIEAGNIKPTAPLRKLIEASSKAASIGCYADGPEEIKRLIEATLATHHLQMDRDTRDILAAMLGNDRMITRSELEKLTLYAYGREIITQDDIVAIMVDASTVALDEAIDTAFSGKRSKIEWHCQRVFQDGGDAGYLLSSALGHALRLHRIRLELDSGAHLESLFSRNGIFAGRKRAVETYFGRWKSERLKMAIDALQEGVTKARQQNRLAQILAVRTLWKISSMVSQGN